MKKLLIAFALMLFSAVSMAMEAPDALVKRTADDVIATIKADKEIQAGNKAKIFELAEEKILPNFNFDKVSRLVLGKNWRRANAEQRAGFKEAFKTLLLHTYATALSKYKDQTIEYKPLRMKKGDKYASVKTLVNQDGGQPIAVNYRLESSTESWKVFDIVIEGVSLVTNYRGQFASEIKANGIDSLIKKLNAKNKANAGK